MKSLSNIFTLLAVSFMLISCSSSWEHKDKLPFNEYKLHRALAGGQFEKQRKASHPYYIAAHSGSKESRNRMTELGDKVFKKAILCMKDKDFVKAGYDSWLEEHQHIKAD